MLLRSALAVALTVTVAGAARASAPRPVSPVIGPARTTPAAPTAGERFGVAFAVRRSDTGAPLRQGTLVCDPSIDGVVLAHTESFAGGVARLSFVVPATAEGKALRVRVVIRLGARSAGRVATFLVPAVPQPAVAVRDVSAVEGNSGTTTFSFPVTLSSASRKSVTVAYTTTDGTAVAGSDYTRAAGTLVFAPGETEKAIPVLVTGDLDQEPDESFTLRLSDAVNATLGQATATGTIVGDELVLTYPTASVPVPQNQTDIGCAADPNRGSGLSIRFAWRTNGRTDITAFGIYIRQASATLNFVVATVGADTPFYTYRSCNAFVADANLGNWNWSVRAVNAAGQTVASAIGVFSFAPCRLADGRACSAPG